MGKRRPNSKLLLALLRGTGQIVVNYIRFLHDLKYWRSAYQRGGRAYVDQLKQLRRPLTAAQALTTLQRSGFIIIRGSSKQQLVSLTHKGRTAALAEELRRAPPRIGQSFTLVIFDIPETASRIRQRFRWLLRQGGFIKLQQSVWLSQQNVYGLIVDFIKQERLTRWVNVLEATRLLFFPHEQKK